MVGDGERDDGDGERDDGEGERDAGNGERDESQVGTQAHGDGDRDCSRPALADRRDLDRVYQPAEDSRLLADAVVEVADSDDRVLEVGTGSGYVAARVASETGASVVGIDLSREACEQTRDRGVPVVRGDLVSPFREGAFDLVCFNPPYLPTPPELEWDDTMEAALSGGETGRDVVDPFLETVGRVVAPSGRVLLLVSTLTDVEAVRDLASRAGLRSTILEDAAFPFERLVVLSLEAAGTE